MISFTLMQDTLIRGFAIGLTIYKKFNRIPVPCCCHMIPQIGIDLRPAGYDDKFIVILERNKLQKTGLGHPELPHSFPTGTILADNRHR